MVEHKKVRYNGKVYCVCCYTHKEKTCLFIIDSADIELLDEINSSWYRVGNHIGCIKTKKDGTKAVYYVHKIVMKEDIGQKKGYSIEHINGNINDNRKENLRLITQTDKKQLKGISSECDIDPQTIPKEIRYDAPKQRFVIEIKKNGEIIFLKKLTDNPKISIEKKLLLAKKELVKIYKDNSDLEKPDEKNNDDKKLLKQFNDIIKLAGYDLREKRKQSVDEDDEITPRSTRTSIREGTRPRPVVKQGTIRKPVRQSSANNGSKRSAGNGSMKYSTKNISNQ